MLDDNDMQIRRALNDAIQSIDRNESPEKKRASIQAALNIMQNFLTNPITPSDPRTGLKRGIKAERTSGESNK